MLRSLLSAKSFIKFNFSKFIINQSNFQSIRQSFNQKPQTSTFGSFFTYQNASQIFSIVTTAKQLQKTHRIAILNELESMCEKQQSHKSNSDQGLNLLANIHFHKSMELNTMGQYELTIKEIQASIAIIEIMEHPDYYFLGELQRSRGEAYLKLHQLTKAQHAFLKAESYLKQILDDFLEQQNDQNISKQNKVNLKSQIHRTRITLAYTLTQLANTFIKQNKVYQAKSQIQKSLQTWDYITNFKGIPFYQMTIRIKCILHIMFNERNDALESSNNLLEYLQDTKYPKMYKSQEKLISAKIWHMNFIVSNYKEQNLGIYLNMKQKWEKRLIQVIKEAKQIYKPNQFQIIMKSTGLTQEKLAKYGLV